MVKLGDWIDSNAPRDLLNDYERETKEFMQALFQMYETTSHSCCTMLIVLMQFVLISRVFIFTHQLPL